MSLDDLSRIYRQVNDQGEEADQIFGELESKQGLVQEVQISEIQSATTLDQLRDIAGRMNEERRQADVRGRSVFSGVRKLVGILSFVERVKRKLRVDTKDE